MYKGRKSKKLNGKSVLVHPDLTIDPAGMQGNIGRITNDDGEHVTVAFEDGPLAKYSYDGLLVLADKKTILGYLVDTVNNMSSWEKSCLLDVLKHQQEGDERQALMLLNSMPKVMEHCTCQCSKLKEQTMTRKKKKLNP